MSSTENTISAPVVPPASPDEQLKIATAAISHVLNAICDDSRKFYLMGWGTGSYAKLTEAHAILHGLPVEQVRENFVPDKAPYARYCKRLEEDERLIEIGREHSRTCE